MNQLTFFLGMIVFISLRGNAQQVTESTNLQYATSLPRSTPEAEGVSSRMISVFLDSVANSKHEFHSFMLLRHGKVIAKGWWNPYRAD